MCNSRMIVDTFKKEKTFSITEAFINQENVHMCVLRFIKTSVMPFLFKFIYNILGNLITIYR